MTAAGTPRSWLDDVADDRRALVDDARALVNDAVAPGFDEIVDFGMLSWVVPLSVVPKTYNGHPLPLVSLAVQKRHTALYLMCVYSAAVSETDFRARWNPPSGRKLDMGRACLRFRARADLDEPLLTELISAVTVDSLVESYTAARAR